MIGPPALPDSRDLGRAVPRGAVATLCALILALPTGLAIGHQAKLDSQGRWIHHHTTEYTTCNNIDQNADLETQASNARNNWGWNDGNPISVLRLPPQTECHPGSGAEAHIQLIDGNYGNTGWRASSMDDANPSANAAYHGRHTHIAFNLSASWFNYTNYDRRALVCRELGQVLGIERVFSGQWAAHAADNDCMSFGGSPPDQVSKDENAISFTYTDRALLNGHSATTLGANYSAGAHEISMTLSGSLMDRIALRGSLTGDSYSLQVVAKPGSASPPVGVERLEALIDGVPMSGYPVLQPCSSGACEIERTINVDTSGLPDGPHVLTLRAVDALGLPASRTVEFEVDRSGSIFHAWEVTDNPAQGGATLLEQWGDPATDQSRVEDDDTVTTRAPLPCSSGPGTCMTMRQLSTVGQSSAYVEYAGVDSQDRRIEGRAPMLDTVRGMGSPIATGSLASLLQTWQVPPSGHGETVELYESTEAVLPDEASMTSETTPLSQVRHRVWVDAATGLPLRTEVLNSSGTLVGRTFTTYDPQRLTAGQLSDSHFAVPKPPSTVLEKRVHLYPQAVSTVTDAGTGLIFSGYSLGDEPVLGGRSYCLASVAKVSTIEPATSLPSGPGEDLPAASRSHETVVDYAYNELPANAQCNVGRAPTGSPDLQVMSELAGAPETATTYSEYKQEAEAIASGDPGGVFRATLGGTSTSAYAVPVPNPDLSAADNLSALAEDGVTQVTITGDLADAEVEAAIGGLVR